MNEYPLLFPSIPATRGAIESDLAVHGCAFVININGEDRLIHPNNVVVYGEPKHTKTI